MKTQPWVELTEKLSIDPCCIESVECREVNKTTWTIFIRTTSGTEYRGKSLSALDAAEKYRQIMWTLTP